MKIIVVGAGLAGAAVAHALAMRGCEVTVLDAQSAASPRALSTTSAPSAGLPVALMAPHHSAGNSAISQLSRLGVAATAQAAGKLLTAGQDWQPCGAVQRAGKLAAQPRWYGDAAWVKPAALVAAWLAHPRMTLLAGTPVQRIGRAQPSGAGWQALDVQGRVMAQADAMVLANAYAAQALWGGLNGSDSPSPAQHPTRTGKPSPLPLHQVAGQVVYGPWNAAWQALWPQLLPELQSHLAGSAPPHAAHPSTPCAINGNGHFIPAVPWGHDGALIWLSGSTYEHDVPAPQVTAQGLDSNVLRLQQLIPAAAGLLAQQHSAGQLQGWAGARCTTRDRLPAVGAVSASQTPGLYTCTAMGSRGLSFAAVCGQHLAASIMGAADSPLPVSLQRAIDVARLF
jgi:tRNA 5-methylaminomethyl-2-thiouridine biosynthesis bifunctional protein